MYIAMYDEVDEGTAMYKLAETEDDMPTDARQLSLDEDGYDLPSDWYLQLGREIQKMMDGTLPLSREMPLTPKKLFELDPTPDDGASGVSNYPLLGWNSAAIAHSYNVYLKKGLAVFSEYDLVSSQTDTTLAITSSLENNAIYYWRVDVLTQTQTFTGEIWSFTVEESTGTGNIAANVVSVYPVPANDELRISGLGRAASYSVYNVLGIKLFEGVLGSENSLDVAPLDKGIYLLHVEGNPPVRFVKD